ncbi:MAG: YCF48-related protein [Draconibacterium sp.]
MRKTVFFLLVSFIIGCVGKTKTVDEKAQGKETVSNLLPTDSHETVNGIVFFSFDNGLTWEDKSKGLPDTVSLGLGGIAASDKMLGIAAKEAGIYLFDDAKENWTPIPTDSKIIDSNLGTLAFFKDQIFLGTQHNGVYSTSDLGKTWINITEGLKSMTIRKLIPVGDKLYVGTDAGFYSYNETPNSWEPELVNNTLQVNGITGLNGNIYIGTNQGVFRSPAGKKEWAKVLDKSSVHNINAENNTIFAMTYNELLSSTNGGQTWQNIQKGLPAQLYTFNIISNGNTLFAGQWDGVYRKENPNENWKTSSNGLPTKLAITNMKTYKGAIVVTGNERKLKKGMSTRKDAF